MARTRKRKKEFTYKEGAKWILLGGTGVLTSVLVWRIYKFLTPDEEKFKRLPVNENNFIPGYTLASADRDAKTLYDMMLGIDTTNSKFAVNLEAFAKYNDDMTKAVVNSWNDTIPNQGKSLYTWIEAEYCYWGTDFTRCKEARSRALQRLKQVGAGAVFKKTK